jgi:hypothetical protein
MVKSAPLARVANHEARIPAYVLTVRELFPASEASWRIPTLLLFSGGGMAAGGWIAGLLYDHPDIMRPRSPSPSAPTFSTCLWSACWSDGNATARSTLERSTRGKQVIVMEGAAFATSRVVEIGVVSLQGKDTASTSLPPDCQAIFVERKKNKVSARPRRRDHAGGWHARHRYSWRHDHGWHRQGRL